MAPPDTILYRYTQPSCQLELSAKQSALSRWTGRPLLKHLRFQLHFGDSLPSSDASEEDGLKNGSASRASAEATAQGSSIVVRGDRRQLEMLHDAVRTYVQTFLSEASTQLNAKLSPETGSGLDAGLQLSGAESPDPVADASSPSLRSFAAESPLGVSPAINPSEGLKSAAADSSFLSLSARTLDAHTAENGKKQPVSTDEAQIYLRSLGLTAHSLHLGLLATAASGPVIRLSTLQLFDLITALDEYVARSDALPPLSRSSWLPASTNWAQVAAAALVVVGLTAAIARLVENPTTMLQSNAPTDSQAASSEDQQAAPQLPNLSSEQRAQEQADLPFLNPPAPPEGAIQNEVPELPGIPTERSPVAIPQPVPVPQASLPPAPPAGSPSSQNGATFDIPAAESDFGNLEVDGGFATPGGQTRGGQSRSAASAPAPAQAEDGTIFDTIPQVAEVRSYFQGQWQPQSGLNQTLEYRLSIAPDGSLQQIVPLGQVAGTYVDRTGIPLIGEPFVSPVSGSGTPQIRLVLEPDGGVQAFLEGIN